MTMEHGSVNYRRQFEGGKALECLANDAGISLKEMEGEYVE